MKYQHVLEVTSNVVKRSLHYAKVVIFRSWWRHLYAWCRLILFYRRIPLKEFHSSQMFPLNVVWNMKKDAITPSPSNAQLPSFSKYWSSSLPYAFERLVTSGENQQAHRSLIYVQQVMFYSAIYRFAIEQKFLPYFKSNAMKYVVRCVERCSANVYQIYYVYDYRKNIFGQFSMFGLWQFLRTFSIIQNETFQ